MSPRFASIRHALVLAAGVALSTHACGGDPPDLSACALAAGNISGSPSVQLGTGKSAFIERNNGDRWLSGFGPQGGAHLWLAFKSQGIGPTVTVSYEMKDPVTGAVLYPLPDSAFGKPVKLCPSAAAGGGQTGTNIQGFIDYTFPEPCSRILCGGPFTLSLTLKDQDGRTATDTKEVSGVDLGDTLESAEAHACGGGNASCDGGVR